MPKIKNSESVSEKRGGLPIFIKGKRLSWGVFVLLWLLLLALGTAGYFYYELKWAGQKEKEENVEALVETIGQFIELPSNETPTMATVTDKEKLAGQAFFAKAENGDQVLIYAESGRAILYRPSTKKVIDMTTVSLNEAAPEAAGEETNSQSETPAPPAIIRIALRNGSETVGITNSVEQKISALLPNTAVTSKENAAKKDYAQTLVVDLTGANKESVQQIAQELQGMVVSLPEGEVAPEDADVLVIVADNRDENPEEE